MRRSGLGWLSVLGVLLFLEALARLGVLPRTDFPAPSLMLLTLAQQIVTPSF